MGRNEKKRKLERKKQNLNSVKKEQKTETKLSEKAVIGFKYAIGKTLAGNEIKRKPKYI